MEDNLSKTKSDPSFIAQRINSLRLKRKVSAWQMSIDLDHSSSYVQGIVSGRAFPSMTELYKICDYFHISVYEFFCPYNEQIMEITKGLAELDEDDLDLIINTVNRLRKTYKDDRI